MTKFRMKKFGRRAFTSIVNILFLTSPLAQNVVTHPILYRARDRRYLRWKPTRELANAIHEALGRGYAYEFSSEVARGYPMLADGVVQDAFGYSDEEMNEMREMREGKVEEALP